MDGWFGARWGTIGYMIAGTITTHLPTILAVRLAGPKGRDEVTPGAEHREW